MLGKLCQPGMSWDQVLEMLSGVCKGVRNEVDLPKCREDMYPHPCVTPSPCTFVMAIPAQAAHLLDAEQICTKPLNLGFKSRRTGDATFSLSCSRVNCPHWEPSVFVSGLPSSCPAVGLCVDPFPSWVAAEPSQFSLLADGCSLRVHLPFGVLHKAPGLAQLCQIFTHVPGSPLSPAPCTGCGHQR